MPILEQSYQGWPCGQHFTLEKTKAQKLRNCFVHTYPWYSGGRIRTQVNMKQASRSTALLFLTQFKILRWKHSHCLPVASAAAGWQLFRDQTSQCMIYVIIWLSSYELQTSYSAPQRRQARAQTKCIHSFHIFNPSSPAASNREATYHCPGFSRPAQPDPVLWCSFPKPIFMWDLRDSSVVQFCGLCYGENLWFQEFHHKRK